MFNVPTCLVQDVLLSTSTIILFLFWKNFNYFYIKTWQIPNLRSNVRMIVGSSELQRLSSWNLQIRNNKCNRQKCLHNKFNIHTPNNSFKEYFIWVYLFRYSKYVYSLAVINWYSNKIFFKIVIFNVLMLHLFL